MHRMGRGAPMVTDVGKRSRTSSGAAPEASSDEIRRIYEAWIKGDWSSEDALFAIGDALGLPQPSDQPEGD